MLDSLVDDISKEIEKIDTDGKLKGVVTRLIINCLKPFKITILILFSLILIMTFTQIATLWTTLKINKYINYDFRLRYHCHCSETLAQL